MASSGSSRQELQKLLSLVESVYEDGLRSFDQITSDPEASASAFKKIKDENEETFKDASKRLTKAQTSLEKYFHGSHKEIDDQISLQREENQNLTEYFQAEVNARGKTHKEELRKMNEEHDEMMENKSLKTDREREKAELDHKIAIAILEREQYNEKEEVQETLEQLEKDYQHSIEKLEMEKEDLNNKLEDELKIVDLAWRKLKECHEKQTQEIQKRSVTMDLINAKKTEKQAELEKRKTVRVVQLITDSLLKRATKDSSRHLIKLFGKVLAPFNDIRNALEHIKTECSSKDGETTQLELLVSQLDEIKLKKPICAKQVSEYCEFVFDAPETDEELLNLCTKYVMKMNDLMGDKELSTLSEGSSISGKSIDSLIREVNSINLEMETNNDEFDKNQITEPSTSSTSKPSPPLSVLNDKVEIKEPSTSSARDSTDRPPALREVHFERPETPSTRSSTPTSLPDEQHNERKQSESRIPKTPEERKNYFEFRRNTIRKRIDEKLKEKFGISNLRTDRLNRKQTSDVKVEMQKQPIENNFGPVSPQHDLELAEWKRNLCFDLKEKLDDNIYSKAKDLVQSMIANTSDAEIQKIGDDELKKFEQKVQAYTEALKRNIELIEKIDKIEMNKVPKLPVAPSLNELEKMIREQTQKRMSELLAEAERELSDLRNREVTECCICLTEKPTTLFLPCRHMNTCKICYSNSDIKKCPECRAIIENFIDVFY